MYNKYMIYRDCCNNAFFIVMFEMTTYLDFVTCNICVSFSFKKHTIKQQYMYSLLGFAALFF